MAEYLIYSLDQRGFLQQPLEELAEELVEDQATVEELARAAGRAAPADPPGARRARPARVAAAAARRDRAARTRWCATMVAEHLDDIDDRTACRASPRRPGTRSPTSRMRWRPCARSTRPRASTTGEEPAAAILPDVMVEEVDGRCEVRLDARAAAGADHQPGLQAPAAPGAAAATACRSGSRSAWSRRAGSSTPSPSARARCSASPTCIFERQRDFLERGVRGAQAAAHAGGRRRGRRAHLDRQPRRLGQVRADAARHLPAQVLLHRRHADARPAGSPARPRSSSASRSWSSRRTRSNPLSDDQLAELLEQRDKVKIARRTVTKYRKALAIPSSSQRRVF